MTRPLLLALALGVAPSAGAADDPLTGDVEIDLDALENLSLEDLFDVDVTTATKTERSADEVPAMIEVITAQDIRDRGYRHLGDVLDDLPDNHEDRTNWGIGEPVSQNVGFGYRFDTGQNTLLLFNGQRLNAFLPGNRFGIEEYLLDNVDRIEIIRGPGSALYGANAFTSVINVISKSRMEPDERSYVRGSVGGLPTSGGVSGQVSWKADLGGSFLSGALRVGAERGQELRVVNDLFGDATVLDGVRHALDGDVFFRHDALRLYARADHQVRDAVTGFNGVQPDDDPKLLLQGYAYSLGGDYVQRVSERVDLKYSTGAHVDNWTENGLIPIFQVNAAGDGLVLDANGLPILDTITVERDGQTLDTSFLIDGQGGDTLTADLDLQTTWRYLQDNSLVFGVTGSYDKVLRVYRDTEIQLAPPAFVSFQRLDDDANNWLFDPDASRFTGGAYAQVDYAVAHQLFTYVGARYDLYTGTGDLQQTYTALNPRAGLVWKNRPLGTFKVLFGQATRIPNGFEALSSVTILGTPDNRPEQIDMLQGSWERNVRDVLGLSAGYFYSILSNHLTTDADISDAEAAAGYVGQFVNVAGQHLTSQGVDGKIRLHLQPVDLSANATRYFGTDDGAGEPIAYIPTTMVNANAGAAAWWFHLNVGVNYRAGFTKAAGDPRPVVPNYTLLTPTVAFRPPEAPIELRVGARNALDLDLRFPSSNQSYTDHFPARGLELWGDLTWTQRF